MKILKSFKQRIFSVSSNGMFLAKQELKRMQAALLDFQHPQGELPGFLYPSTSSPKMEMALKLALFLPRFIIGATPSLPLYLFTSSPLEIEKKSVIFN